MISYSQAKIPRDDVINGEKSFRLCSRKRKTILHKNIALKCNISLLLLSLNMILINFKIKIKRLGHLACASAEGPSSISLPAVLNDNTVGAQVK